MFYQNMFCGKMIGDFMSQHTAKDSDGFLICNYSDIYILKGYGSDVLLV